MPEATNLTFQEHCALVALKCYANKLFDPQFQRQASDAGVDPADYLASICWEVASAVDFHNTVEN